MNKFIEKIEKSIEGSNELFATEFAKTRAKAVVKSALESFQDQRGLHSDIDALLSNGRQNKKVKSVEPFGEYYIVKTSEQSSRDSEPTIFFNTVYRDTEGNLRRLSEVSYTFDHQVLITLAFKHDGLNSQFATFASRMLNIDA